MSDPIPQDISIAGCNSTEEAIIHIVGLNHPIKWPIANGMTAENLARTVAVKKLGFGPVVLEVNIKCCTNMILIYDVFPSTLFAGAYRLLTISF